MNWKHWAGAAAAVLAAAALPVAAHEKRRTKRHESTLTLAQLRELAPKISAERAAYLLPFLTAAMVEAQITTLRRRAAFLAQLLLESGEFRYFEEIASGEAYDLTVDPEKARNLGNTQVGDGKRYKGRGPIQLTGRSNYRAAGKALGVDLEGSPELAALPSTGFRVAGWFWTSRNLNPFADVGDFREVTRRINGGYGHLDRREAYYRKALQLLGGVS